MTTTTLMTRWESIAREAKGGIWPGRNELPDVLARAYADGRFDDHQDDLAEALEDAWVGAEFPSRMLDAYVWEEMFGEVGFLHNTERAARPKRLPTLYRAEARLRDNGVDYGWAEGASWTDDFDKAQWFFDRNKNYFQFETRMLRLDTPNPIEALAHFEGGRRESEWVMDSYVYEDAEVIG